MWTGTTQHDNIKLCREFWSWTVFLDLVLEELLIPPSVLFNVLRGQTVLVRRGVGGSDGAGFLCSDELCCGSGQGELLVQGLGSVSLLVQAALAALHHVDEVGERLLLVHRDVPEVTAHRLNGHKHKTCFRLREEVSF